MIFVVCYVRGRSGWKHFFMIWNPHFSKRVADLSIWIAQLVVV